MWKATRSSPELLDIQLGCDWGNCVLANDRFIQVSGPVEMRYCHARQDKVLFTNVILSVDGCYQLDVVVPGNVQPAVDADFWTTLPPTATISSHSDPPPPHPPRTPTHSDPPHPPLPIVWMIS